MAFPRRLLVDHEELVLELRPHPIALLRAALVTLAVIVAWFILLPWLNDDGIQGTLGWIIVAAGFAVFVIWPVRDLIEFLTSYFVVTSDRVIHRSGWIAKRSMEIPLEAINDVRFSQSVFERMINSGDITISSASTHGTETFKDIRDPETVQKTIYHQGELNQQRMMSGRGPAAGGQPAPATPAPAPVAGVADEIRKLDELRDSGAITEAEFEAQKKKLLEGP